MRGGGERSRQRKSMCECWAKLWLAGSRSAWSIGRPERAFQDEAGTYGQKTACRSHGVRQLFHLYSVVGKKQSADLKQRTRCDQVCVRRRVCFKTTQHSGHTVFEAGRSRQELCTSRLWPGLVKWSDSLEAEQTEPWVWPGEEKGPNENSHRAVLWSDRVALGLQNRCSLCLVLKITCCEKR